MCWAFNTRNDHVTIKYSSQPSKVHRALHLVGSNYPPWMVPQKLFWTFKDTSGSPSSVASIHISLVPDAVISLSFTYTSGDTYTLGSMEGEIPTLNLENGEQLIRLDTALAVVNSINSVVLISIHTNQKRVMTLRSQTYVKPKILASSAFLPSLIPLPRRILPASSCVPDYVFSLQPSSGVAQAAHHYEVFGFPTDAEDFVGFWGIVGRRERRLQKLGPILTVAKKE
ncbi:hypothetical protein GQ44DRAFT_721409 [Phaeosphaeriaceae sp. PMI808]|nr:hypothetical protein GQ44DRAFT_721409 [Phaeosphaeriaceae sp. PMI808]